MSFGLGVSFGRLCRYERNRLAFANRGSVNPSSTIVIDREWEDEKWTYYEYHDSSRPVEAVLYEANGTKFVMTNKGYGMVLKNWTLNGNDKAFEQADSVIVLGESR